MNQAIKQLGYHVIFWTHKNSYSASFAMCNLLNTFIRTSLSIQSMTLDLELRLSKWLSIMQIKKTLMKICK